MIKGIEKLTQSQIQFMEYLHNMQKGCFSPEYQKGMEIIKVKFDTNGIKRARNGSLFFAYLQICK